MHTYNITNDGTELSRLVEQAARGNSFVIAQAGKPMVKVTALDSPASLGSKRFGFMAGQISVPDDFDRMGAAAISMLFEKGR